MKGQHISSSTPYLVKESYQILIFFMHFPVFKGLLTRKLSYPSRELLNGIDSVCVTCNSVLEIFPTFKGSYVPQVYCICHIMGA